MDQWLDSLSEDWVSQPRSSHSSSIIQESVRQGSSSPSPSSNASQSRIPRYKPRSVSNLPSTNGKVAGKVTSRRNFSEKDAPLREKTSSNLNKLHQVQRNGQPQVKDPHTLSPAVPGKRQVSSGTPQKLLQDTVQCRLSPRKSGSGHCTPEWKRRVLKENVGGDLFSPIGLEGVFKPPTVKKKSQSKKVAKKGLALKGGYPSNPPLSPSVAHQTATDMNTNIEKPTNNELPPPGSPGKKVAKDFSEPDSDAQRPTQSPSVMGTCPDKAQHSNEPGAEKTTQLLRSPPSSPVHSALAQRPELDSSMSMNREGQSNISDNKTRNESISPLFVSRQDTVDGRVEYAAIDKSMQRLRYQMDRLRSQQQNIPSSRSSDHDIDYIESKPSEPSELCERMGEVTSQSLPDDLSMGTDAYAANGGFVSLRRGGYSNDGSFQRRPISPSLLHDLDGPSLKISSSTGDDPMAKPGLPPNFSQTKSKTPSSQPPSPSLSEPPQTPGQTPKQQPSSDERPKSSGSPLKLFDKYDTFTNERLVRRMSKFEQTLQQDLQQDEDGDGNQWSPSSPSPRRRRQHIQRHTDSSISTESQIGHRVSSFGDGELNSHRFPRYLDIDTQSPEQIQDPRKGLKRANQGGNKSRPPSDVLHDSKKERISGKIFPHEYVMHPEALWSENLGDLGRKSFSGEDRREIERTATRKRLPYSPIKDPASKRRRTLQNPEETGQAQDDIQQHIDTREDHSRQVSGRKRKDALYDSDRQAADADTMAKRQIRHPKTPTPSQSCYPKPEEMSAIGEIGTGLDQEIIGRPPTIDEDIHSAIDPPTQIVAGALATVALHTAQEVTYGSRKASVTTADFFNEAQQIMQLIRAKGRPRSSHATTETSEVGQPTIAEESMIEDSTKEEFSRPPSREGSPRELKEPTRSDARVVSHLRRFKDNRGLELALSSSIKSLKISESRRPPEASRQPQGKEQGSHSAYESDPPNTHIRQGEVHLQKVNLSPSTTHSFSAIAAEQQMGSQDSSSSSGHPTNQSDPTGSSRSSTNRMVIAPETVAHLLSDQMAGMVFDRQKQLWVKRKSTPNVHDNENHNHTASEGTEDDFFGDIPDLSVNEMDELQRVKEAVSSVKSLASASNGVAIQDQACFNDVQHVVMNHIEPPEDVRPRTAEGKSIPAMDDSSAPSKYSHLASSGPQLGTRATSWGEDAFPHKEPQLPQMPRSDTSKFVNIGHEEQVEHEISIYDGREARTPQHKSSRKHQARVVTVAFSSPLVDQREEMFERDEESDMDHPKDATNADEPGSPHNNNSSRKPTSSGSGQKQRRASALRRMSVGNQSFIARPMSRLDEEDEMSLVHCSIANKGRSMEVAITTPLPMSKSLVVPSSYGHQSSIGFALSPLPDFTVHQVDKPIDGTKNQVSKRLPVRKSDDKLSLAAHDLVKNLTDLEPYEPYWDFVRTVDLHDRGISTLHMLDEFCGRVEELDVSDNEIRELDGIPYTVRQLKINGNCLSDLTAWDFLQNLQYLDVSHNRVTSLQGFQHLIHLRSIKADDNGIRNLQGIEDLTGLTSLSLRNNRLQRVDFETFDLQRLLRLDLHNNELVSVENLHQLPALQMCNLSHNDLEALHFAISIPLNSLTSLDLSHNQLSFIDLAEVPNLKTFNIDANSIASIESLDKVTSLETLSWRSQTLFPAYGHSKIQYQECHEVRNLYLSGNKISTFAPLTPFLNLNQLELASAGLQSFSSDFGLKCPNLRKINANYNAIRDLRPLLGIVKLQRLSIAGNRVTRLRRTSAVLDRLGAQLLNVDLRNNPLTVGFYTPQESSPQDAKQMTLRKSSRSSYSGSEDAETRAATAYLLPALDKLADNSSRERLDEDTKLRRRVYEMLIVNGCKRLERLDGLEVDRGAVGRRDGVWERLVELGVLKERGGKGGGGDDEEEGRE